MNLVENIIASLLVFGASFILDILPINYTLIIIGWILVITVLILLDYMRNTVGLKMEEYGKKEIL